jgi:hypothetical protein
MPRPGAYRAFNQLVEAIPEALFTRVMDKLFDEVDSEADAMAQIRSGSVPTELLAMFDMSGPMPRLLSEDVLFGTPVAPVLVTSLPVQSISEIRDTTEYLPVEKLQAVAGYPVSDDPKDVVSVVVDVRQEIGSSHAPCSAYRFPDPQSGFVVDPTGKVTLEEVFSIPVPGFVPSVFGPFTRSQPPTGRFPCAAYLGGGVIGLGPSWGTLVIAANHVWTGDARGVPLGVMLSHLHSSGRYWTRCPDQLLAASVARLDSSGVPVGYSDFITSTLLPRDCTVINVRGHVPGDRPGG